MSGTLSAIGSAMHVLGIALVFTGSTYRVVGMWRRDVEATRHGDNTNGIGALLLIGSGLWRLFGALEKPMAFYTENPVFWVKMALLGAAGLLEIYPQVVLLPWQFQAGRRPIVPKPHQFPIMFRLAAAQLPCMVAVVICATFMARGLGLPVRDSASATAVAGASAEGHPGRALYVQYCQACHQPDGKGLDGLLAADFVDDPGSLAKTDQMLLAIIERGTQGAIGTMPAWGQVLSEAQRREVLAFIRGAFGPAR